MECLPVPSTVMLYKEGERHPTFDFAKVNDRIARLVQETIEKWDMAGL
jgi:creatinine amidohydrolase